LLERADPAAKSKSTVAREKEMDVVGHQNVTADRDLGVQLGGARRESAKGFMNSERREQLPAAICTKGNEVDGVIREDRIETRRKPGEAVHSGGC
jgi:hypothetical protein